MGNANTRAWDAVSLIGGGALILFAALSLAAETAPVDPPAALELKLVGQTECATGWDVVSVDDGWVVHYPMPNGLLMPNWISDAQLSVAFSDPDGRVIEAALTLAKGHMRQRQRVVCRWAPLTVGGDPAD